MKLVIVIVIVVIVIVMQPFCRYAGYAPFPRLISFLSDDYDSMTHDSDLTYGDHLIWSWLLQWLWFN